MQTKTKTLWSYLAIYRRLAMMGFLFVFGATVVGLAIPFILRFAIDAFTHHTMTPGRLYQFAAVYFLASCVSASLAFGMRRILLGLAHQIEYDIRRDVFAKLTTLDATFYLHERTGDIMTKMTSDLGAVRDFIGQGLLQGSRTLIGFVLAFSIMFAINVRMAWVILMLLPVISAMFFVLIRLIRKRYDASQSQFSVISNYAQETFSGIRTIKGFGIEDRQRSFFRELNTEFIRRNLALSRVEEPVWPLMALLFAVGTILLLCVGGRQVVQGELTLGEFVQFNQYLVYLQWPMLALGWTTNLLQRGLASWQRIQAIMNAQAIIRDNDQTNTAITALHGDIVFKNTTLIREGKRIINDISLKIPEGKTVGITGPTGSGKTSLVSLIARLIDTDEGAVEIGGRNVKKYSVDVLRRHIGFAPQEPFLFSDTLANNIAFGLGEAQEERILWAANVAHLRNEVDLFPEKFETILGERGVTLSGGQRQRTAISRAIARQPNIIILDDVLSAVDTQTEAAILTDLRPVLKERTSVLVSHRVSTLRYADFIVVIEQGRITQQGTHDELTKQPGYYRELDEAQRLEAQLEST